jgi:hypothetical protein
VPSSAANDTCQPRPGAWRMNEPDSCPSLPSWMTLSEPFGPSLPAHVAVPVTLPVKPPVTALGRFVPAPSIGQ